MGRFYWFSLFDCVACTLIKTWTSFSFSHSMYHFQFFRLQDNSQNYFVHHRIASCRGHFIFIKEEKQRLSCIVQSLLKLNGVFNAQKRKRKKVQIFGSSSVFHLLSLKLLKSLSWPRGPHPYFTEYCDGVHSFFRVFMVILLRFKHFSLWHWDVLSLCWNMMQRGKSLRRE